MGIFDALFGAKSADDESAAEPSDNNTAPPPQWYLDGEYEHDDDDEGERINVWDAADIYFDSGFDEDRMFGYSHEELENAHES